MTWIHFWINFVTALTFLMLLMLSLSLILEVAALWTSILYCLSLSSRKTFKGWLKDVISCGVTKLLLWYLEKCEANVRGAQECESAKQPPFKPWKHCQQSDVFTWQSWKLLDKIIDQYWECQKNITFISKESMGRLRL